MTAGDRTPVASVGDQEGSVLVVSAPSGAGKTTLCKRLLREDPRIDFSVSFTTRAPRAGEKEGVDYFFVDAAEFERRRARGEFVEWALVGGHLYGTSAESVREASERGRDILLDVDTQGAVNLRRLIPQAVLIFILPPGPGSLRERLVKRGTDAPEEVARRMALAPGEIARCRAYDYIIINDNVETAYHHLRALVEAARCRTDRQRRRLEMVLREFSLEGTIPLE